MSAHYAEAVRLEPNRVENRLLLASALARQGKTREQRQSWKRSFDLIRATPRQWRPSGRYEQSPVAEILANAKRPEAMSCDMTSGPANRTRFRGTDLDRGESIEPPRREDNEINTGPTTLLRSR